MAMAPPPSWAILRTVVRVSPDGADVSLALAAPPRLTHLTVSPAEPNPDARIHSPRLLTADPSGLLLANTPPPLSTREPAEERVHRGRDGVERTITVSHIPKPDYAVLDLASAPAHRIFSAACLGVIAAPAPDADAGFMVVEFQSIVGGDRATLHCFSSHTGAWATKTAFRDVVSHSGKLSPPRGSSPAAAISHCYYCSQRMIASRRFVQLSNDSFRCVNITPVLPENDLLPWFRWG